MCVNDLTDNLRNLHTMLLKLSWCSKWLLKHKLSNKCLNCFTGIYSFRSIYIYIYIYIYIIFYDIYWGFVTHGNECNHVVILISIFSCGVSDWCNECDKIAYAHICYHENFFLFLLIVWECLVCVYFTPLKNKDICASK